MLIELIPFTLQDSIELKFKNHCMEETRWAIGHKS